MLNQRQSLTPRHILVLHALQNVDRAMAADRRLEQEMGAAFLNQIVRYRIWRNAIARWTQPDSLIFDCGAALSVMSVQSSISVKSMAGAISTRPRSLSASPPANNARAASSASPSAHRRPNEDLRAFGQRPEPGKSFFKPYADRARLKSTFRFAMLRNNRSRR